MKRLALFILITTLSIAAKAVDLVDGYFVMENNDTIKCKIKGGRFLANPYSGITVVDDKGEEQAYRAKDKKIIAFGFTEKLRKVDYKYIDAGGGARLEDGFYQLMVNGVKFKLYGKPPTTSGGNPTYALFNPSGEYAVFEPCLVCPWKKRLREFFKDDPKALEKVEDAPRVNIPKFVIALNEG